ncbi:E3 ubiquitin-protein ligase NRDP1 [Armadillidium nasatum]|uniref:E3 ubiquitin-protein ligase NRDP1 n=1 Tax=Armadillidium nasatum TaxID=96803 RepID=A0A5N5TF43_9CRUS|nr:E3 ubiquitin-protein ligase NRDP1 [Armadillidium nasatum]
MGFDVTRFQGDVDEELLCPICSEVLQEATSEGNILSLPLSTCFQAPSCEHAFCSGCIHEWLSRQQTCPVDRQPITPSQLKQVPRILKSLLSKLYIACDNKPHGCVSVVKLDCLKTHLEECDFNPKRPVPCEQGCGLVVPKDELKDHNCLRELRSLMQNQTNKIAELQQDIIENKFQLNEQKQEIQLLKDFMRAMRSSNPQMRAIADQMEQDEVVRWSSTLGRARVTRWGGMISTPDAMLQAVIRRALSESGCPPHIIDQLMENAHERRWPPGLSTLETRQVKMNRRMYENYISKRVPGKQAVVVLACDNRHMNEDMILDPGLVMIFAHGIE